MAVKREEPQVQTELPQVKKDKREFIGKAWLNKVLKGDHEGTEYINLTLDNNIQEVVIEKGNRLLLWPNEKREGKQDADFRVSLVQTAA